MYFGVTVAVLALQVTIEVDPASQTEVELDLSDTRTDWADPDWVSQHELFWPLFWEYNDIPGEETSTPGPSGSEIAGDYSSQYEWEDNILSGRDPNGENWISEDKYHYGESPQSPNHPGGWEYYDSSHCKVTEGKV